LHKTHQDVNVSLSYLQKTIIYLGGGAIGASPAPAGYAHTAKYRNKTVKVYR